MIAKWPHPARRVFATGLVCPSLRALTAALGLFAVVVWTAHSVGLTHVPETPGCNLHCHCPASQDASSPAEGAPDGPDGPHCPICLLAHGGQGVVAPEPGAGAAFGCPADGDGAPWIDTYDFHKRLLFLNDAPLRGPPPCPVTC